MISESVPPTAAEATPTTPPAITPADVADAARLVSFGVQPKLLPSRDTEYAELIRRYRDDPAFARLADAVAALAITLTPEELTTLESAYTPRPPTGF